MFKRWIVRFLENVIGRLMDNSVENAHNIVTRGYCRASDGNLDGAIEDFSAAIELLPSYGDAYRHRALAYLQLHQREHAMEDILQDLKLRPENAATRSTYGDVLRSMGQHVEALREYERSLEINPNEALACLGIGYCHFDQGNWVNAVEYFQQCFLMGVKDPEAEVYYKKAMENAGIKASK